LASWESLTVEGDADNPVARGTLVSGPIYREPGVGRRSMPRREVLAIAIWNIHVYAAIWARGTIGAMTRGFVTGGAKDIDRTQIELPRVSVGE